MTGVGFGRDRKTSRIPYGVEPFPDELRQEVRHESSGARLLGAQRRPHELQDLAAVLAAKAGRVERQQQRDAAFDRAHGATFLTRAALTSAAMRAVSARSTRAPSLVMR